MRSQTSYAFSINCDESSGYEKQTLTFFFTGNNVKCVKVMVPLFINQGEKITVNTTDRSYGQRV